MEVKKLMNHFASHFLTEVFGVHILRHNHVQFPGGREMVTKQRQKKLHIKHVKRLTTFEFKGVSIPYKQIRLYMADESVKSRVKDTSLQRELISMQVQCEISTDDERHEMEGEDAAHAEEAEAEEAEVEGDEAQPKERVTVARPVFNEVYYDPHRGSITIAVVSCRKECMAVYERTREHFRASIDGFFIKQGYHE